MRKTKKNIINVMIFCMVLVGMMFTSQKVYAKNSDFVIENGVLIKYNGNANTVTVPKGVTVIGRSAFSGSNITKVELPKGLKKIEYSAFSSCKNLKSITIPNGVAYIGDSAFNWCECLKTINIPKSTTYIGVYAFGSFNKKDNGSATPWLVKKQTKEKTI